MEWLPLAKIPDAFDAYLEDHMGCTRVIASASASLQALKAITPNARAIVLGDTEVGTDEHLAFRPDSPDILASALMRR